MVPVGHGKSLRLTPWSFSVPETGVVIGKTTPLPDKTRPHPAKLSPAVVPAFFELGGGEPRRARIARTSVLERAAATPPIPVGELNVNPSRSNSLTFCGCATDSAVSFSIAFEGGEFPPSENAMPQPDSVGVVVVLARPLRTCGMEVAEPQGAARRRMRPCRGVRTIDA